MFPELCHAINYEVIQLPWASRTCIPYWGSDLLVEAEQEETGRIALKGCAGPCQFFRFPGRDECFTSLNK